MRTFDLGIGDVRRDTAQNAIDNAVLQLERIVRRAIETVAPDVPICGDIDEPDDHTRALITLRQSALQAVLRAAISRLRCVPRKGARLVGQDH